MTVRSRSIRYFRISLLILIAILFIIYGVINNYAVNFIFAAIIFFIVFIELFTHDRTTIKLTSSHLEIESYKHLNLIHEEFKINIDEIQSSYYHKKTYDNWELLQRFFLEIFLPSGQSFFIINKRNGKTIKILFNGNEEEMMQLMEKLPERIPNT